MHAGIGSIKLPSTSGSSGSKQLQPGAGTKERRLFLKFQKIKKGNNSALIAARHNLRELPPARHIQTSRTALNSVLKGPDTAQGVGVLYRSILQIHGIHSLRKNAVDLIEAIVSLPTLAHDPKQRYFKAALHWTEQEFGADNVISATIHQDEGAPHLHLLIIPLVNGKMRGSEMVGSPSQLKKRNRRFFEALHPFFDHDNWLSKEEVSHFCISHFQQHNDPILQSQYASKCLELIKDNPYPIYQKIKGLVDLAAAPLPKSIEPFQTAKRPSRPKRKPTMAEIFTRPDRKLRGSAAERYRESEEFRRVNIVAPIRAQSTPLAKRTKTRIAADSSPGDKLEASKNHCPARDIKPLEGAQHQPANRSAETSKPQQQRLDFTQQIGAQRFWENGVTIKNVLLAGLNEFLKAPSPLPLSRVLLQSGTPLLKKPGCRRLKIWSTYSAFATSEHQFASNWQSLCSVGFAHSPASKCIDLNAVLRTLPIRRASRELARTTGQHHSPKIHAPVNPSQHKIKRCWLLQARPAPASLWAHRQHAMGYIQLHIRVLYKELNCWRWMQRITQL